MEKLLVQKFGGTSVADAGRIEVVADIIAKTIQKVIKSLLCSQLWERKPIG